MLTNMRTSFAKTRIVGETKQEIDTQKNARKIQKLFGKNKNPSADQQQRSLSERKKKTRKTV